MWAIYKKGAALQTSLIVPELKDATYKTVVKSGAIYFEMANSTGKDREYDWAKEKKVNFAVSTNDLPKIYKAIQDSKKSGVLDLKLLHDPGAGTDQKGKIVKTLTIKNATNPGTFYFSIFYNSGIKSSISLDNGELYMLIRYIEDNQNTILGNGDFTVSKN